MSKDLKERFDLMGSIEHPDSSNGIQSIDRRIKELSKALSRIDGEVQKHKNLFDSIKGLDKRLDVLETDVPSKLDKQRAVDLYMSSVILDPPMRIKNGSYISDIVVENGQLKPTYKKFPSDKDTQGVPRAVRDLLRQSYVTNESLSQYINRYYLKKVVTRSHQEPTDELYVKDVKIHDETGVLHVVYEKLPRFGNGSTSPIPPNHVDREWIEENFAKKSALSGYISREEFQSSGNFDPTILNNYVQKSVYDEKVRELTQEINTLKEQLETANNGVAQFTAKEVELLRAFVRDNTTLENGNDFLDVRDEWTTK